MYEGLKKVNCKVIWSLRAPNKLHEEGNPNFWASPWLPQIECLAHPGMKAGVSHMGMGGMLEFISCGVPLITWPHAEDQPYNAKCIIDNNAGIPLWTKERYGTRYD